MTLPPTQTSPYFGAPYTYVGTCIVQEEWHIMKICISIMPVLQGSNTKGFISLSLSSFLFRICSNFQKTVLLNIVNPLARM